MPAATEDMPHLGAGPAAQEPLRVMRHRPAEVADVDPRPVIVRAFAIALHSCGVVCIACGRVFTSDVVDIPEMRMCTETFSDGMTYYAVACSELCKTRVGRRGWLVDRDKEGEGEIYDD